MKVTGWPGPDAADVGLVDRHPDLHALEVLGDQEQAGGVQAGHDGLADVDAAVDDDAFDRRGDRAVAQVALGPLQRGFAWVWLALACRIAASPTARLAFAVS